MEGYDVMPMEDAAEIGDVFLTTTGNRDVVVKEHFEKMQDGVLLANAGHFDVEVDLDALSTSRSTPTRPATASRPTRWTTAVDSTMLAEGRLVNLATPIALGHPVEVMDQSFGVQAVCVRELVENGDAYDAGVHDVPDRLDKGSRRDQAGCRRRRVRRVVGRAGRVYGFVAARDVGWFRA